MANRSISQFFTLILILQNPFYCGMLSHSLLEGEIVEGKYEKLVSKELFLKANGEKSKIPHGYKVNPLNDELPLKLFFKCDSFKEYLRGYIVKAKGLHYNKCNHGGRCSCNRSAKQLHSLFETILNELNITQDDVEPLKAQLRKIYTALNTEKEEHMQQYKLNQKSWKIRSSGWKNGSSMKKSKQICMRSSRLNFERRGRNWMRL